MVLKATTGAQLAGRYRLEKLLGGGGMGTVWQAHDEVLGRAVAIKFVNSRTDGDPRAESLLHREALALGRLTHPHLAHVHDLCDTDDGTFIVMELIHGESLADRLAREPRPSSAEAARITAQCAEALGSAHEAGIVHRDVKPSNIMLAGDDVKIIDFGIAGSMNPADTTVPGVMGTVAYLAPERVTGSPATPATDMYALGVVLYEMLAGRLPFGVEESIAMLYAHVTAEPLPLPTGTAAELAETCMSLLAKDPAARPGSAEVARDARRVAGDSAADDALASTWLAEELGAVTESVTGTPHGAESGSGSLLGPAMDPAMAAVAGSATETTSRRPREFLLVAGVFLAATMTAGAAWLITASGTPDAATAQPGRIPSTAAAHSPTTAPTSPAPTTTAVPQPTSGNVAFSVPATHPGNPHPGKPSPKPKPPHKK